MAIGRGERGNRLPEPGITISWKAKSRHSTVRRASATSRDWRRTGSSPMTWIASATGRTQQENIDAGQTRLEQGLPRRLQGDGRTRGLREGLGPRPSAAPSGEDARLPDQRLRVLPRHAQQGRARGGRDRAAALRAQRVARDAVY